MLGTSYFFHLINIYYNICSEIKKRAHLASLQCMLFTMHITRDDSAKTYTKKIHIEVNRNGWTRKEMIERTQKTYYHLRSTVKREHFFAEVYFSNETVSQTTVSTGPIKMFRLEHETIDVCHVLFTCSAGLTKLTTFFRVLEAWCHCDFRKMEAPKVTNLDERIALEHRRFKLVVRSYNFFKTLYPSVRFVKT